MPKPGPQATEQVNRVPCVVRVETGDGGAVMATVNNSAAEGRKMFWDFSRLGRVRRASDTGGGYAATRASQARPGADQP
jgi:hypothetical protein